MAKTDKVVDCDLFDVTEAFHTHRGMLAAQGDNYTDGINVAAALLTLSSVLADSALKHKRAVNRLAKSIEDASDRHAFNSGGY